MEGVRGLFQRRNNSLRPKTSPKWPIEPYREFRGSENTYCKAAYSGSTPGMVSTFPLIRPPLFPKRQADTAELQIGAQGLCPVRYALKIAICVCTSEFCGNQYSRAFCFSPKRLKERRDSQCGPKNFGLGPDLPAASRLLRGSP